MIRSIAIMLALLCTSPVTTEMAEVPGRGSVDLEPFTCTDTPRSTVVQRVCFDEARGHLLVNVGGTYSEHCRLSTATFRAFVGASSMGQFYRQRLASASQFACNDAAGS